MRTYQTQLLIFGITLLAATLRIIELNSGLWLDEITTLTRFARSPISQIVFQYSTNNHPLYSVLAHASLELFGEFPWSVRFPAVLFGIASVPMLYCLGTHLTSKGESLLSATLLAVSYHHIWFSQNARGYTALAFWTLLSTFLLINGLRQHNTTWYWSYAVTTALGIYTHLAMGFVLLAQCSVLIWYLSGRTEQSSTTIRWLATAGVCLAALFALLLYSPMLFQVLNRLTRPSGLYEFATPGWAFWETIDGLKRGFGTWGAFLAFALFLIGLRDYYSTCRFIPLMFLSTICLTTAGTWVMRQPTEPRFFFLLIGLGVLVIVRGAFVLGNWAALNCRAHCQWQLNAAWLGSALVFVLIFSNTLSLGYLYRYPKQDYDGAALHLRAHRTDGEPVMAIGTGPNRYKEYAAENWVTAHNWGEIHSVSSPTRRKWVIWTLPQYLDPNLNRSLHQNCQDVITFPGTLSGGDVFLCSLRE